MSGGDWLLLKRGDTFNEAISNSKVPNGLSEENKTVIGAYGDESNPRPIIALTKASDAGLKVTRGDIFEHVAVVSVHFYNKYRDPSSKDFVGITTGNSGISVITKTNDFLVEDTKIDYFGGGMSVDAMVKSIDSIGFHKDITLRRNTIRYNYQSVKTGHSQGIFLSYINGVNIEENFFDHNGFYEGLANCEQTKFNHNMYIQSTNTNVTIKHNISSRASSHGMQLRTGGTAVENVFIGNAIAGFISTGNLGSDLMDEKAVKLNGNVVLEAASWSVESDNVNSTRGWGLQVFQSKASHGIIGTPDIAQMKDNIVVNGPSIATKAYQYEDTWTNPDYSNNITYNWGNSVDSNGNYPDPNRTSGSYNASLGGEATMLAYLDNVAKQRKGNWDLNYTWEGIWNYIKEGFGKTSSDNSSNNEGWTKFTLGASNKIYYVSSSAGSDSNDGLSETTPFATIKKGISQLNGGDWLLLKRGDTFYETIGNWVNGTSTDNKTVIGAYGSKSKARPIIDPQGYYGMKLTGGSGRPATLEHIAFINLHLYQAQHDPSSNSFIGGSNGKNGILVLRGADDVIFEGLLVEYFATNVFFQAFDGAQSNITLRRNVIRNAYSTTKNSAGLLASGVNKLTIEENFFDNNGYNANVDGDKVSLDGSNIKIASDCSDVTVQHNISARAAASGLQLYSGGIVSGNIFVENAIASEVYNGNIGGSDSKVVSVKNNIVLEGADWAIKSKTYGWGLALKNLSQEKSNGTVAIPDTLEMVGNIVANGPSVATRAYKIDNVLNSVAQVSNNISYNWGDSIDTSGNYTDSTRTTASYNSSLGATATMEAYLKTVGEQRFGNWNSNYSWEGIWKYIREGFNMSTEE